MTTSKSRYIEAAVFSMTTSLRLKLISSASSWETKLPREECVGICKNRDKPVNAEAYGGRHAVFKRFKKIFVQTLSLFVANEDAGEDKIDHKEMR